MTAPSSDPPADASAAAQPALPPAMQAALGDFLLALRVEAGLAANTLKAYRSDLERFLHWSVPRGLQSFQALDADQIIDFLDAERAAGRAVRAAHRRALPCPPRRTHVALR